MERFKKKRERTEYFREYYLKNKAKKLEARRKYLLENKEKALECVRASGKKHFYKNKIKIYKYRNNRYANDIQFRITEVLRKRLKNVCKPIPKYKNALELLGCSIEYFRQYISSQFQEGMSWENHGLKTWHIDHIKPCAAFDLTKEEEQKKCFHYTNLQPLWAIDNMKKGAKAA